MFSCCCTSADNTVVIIVMSNFSKLIFFDSFAVIGTLQSYCNFPTLVALLLSLDKLYRPLWTAISPRLQVTTYICHPGTRFGSAPLADAPVLGAQSIQDIFPVQISYVFFVRPNQNSDPKSLLCVSLRFHPSPITLINSQH